MEKVEVVEKKQTKQLKCQRKDCGHVWNYKGDASFWTSCPICKSSVNVRQKQVPDK